MNSGASSSVRPQGPLEVGFRQPLHVREERLSELDDPCRVLFISDIHLRPGRSELLCQQVVDAVDLARPDVVLLGGDLVDLRAELVHLNDLVRTLQRVAPVLAIGGNHDERVGLELVRDAVVSGGGQWIHDGIAQLTHERRTISISGPETATRRDGSVRILCAHNPRVWRTARSGGFDLVLAGHLHGCQLVAWEYKDRLLPGAFFYPYCFLNHRRGGTRLVVSRGVSDLVPIRWRCPREVVLCHV